MTKLLLDKLAVSRMVSGHLNLDLSERISWDDFPAYALELVKLCGGTIKDKSDSPDTRIWSVYINKVELRLVYDDYPQMISLESSSNGADEEIKGLHKRLSVKKES